MFIRLYRFIHFQYRNYKCAISAIQKQNDPYGRKYASVRLLQVCLPFRPQNFELVGKIESENSQCPLSGHLIEHLNGGPQIKLIQFIGLCRSIAKVM